MPLQYTIIICLFRYTSVYILVFTHSIQASGALLHAPPEPCLASSLGSRPSLLTHTRIRIVSTTVACMSSKNLNSPHLLDLLLLSPKTLDVNKCVSNQTW